MPLSPISPSGVSTAYLYPYQNSAGQGPAALLIADPGNVNGPIIFEPGPLLTNNTLQVWMIVTGPSANWGGCQVHISVDNVSYGYIGTIGKGAVQGTLTADFPVGTDPDTTDTLSVDITESLGQLTAATDSDADSHLTLAYLGGTGLTFELISYSAATLTSSYNYDLDTYIRRGVLDSSIEDHPLGSQFGLAYAAFVHGYLPNMVGQTIYLKFPSFNQVGANLQDISTLSPYTYVLTGNGVPVGGPSAWFQSFSVGAKIDDLPQDEFDGNYEIFDVQMPGDIAFSANFADSPIPGCEVGPSPGNETVLFDIITAGVATNAGQMVILAGATTGTYSTVGGLGFTVSSGDRLRAYIVNPSSHTIGLYGTLVGRRL
jgi:hypothetical protein